VPVRSFVATRVSRYTSSNAAWSECTSDVKEVAAGGSQCSQFADRHIRDDVAAEDECIRAGFISELLDEFVIHAAPLAVEESRPLVLSDRNVIDIKSSSS